MSDRPQGPGWWQASDLKWYPPEQHANYVAPPSSPATPTPSPGTTSGNAMTPPPQWGPPHRGPSRRKVWLVVAGVGVLIAVIVVGVGGQHPSQPAPSGHQSAAPHPGKQDSPAAGHTDSYKSGYWFAYQNSDRRLGIAAEGTGAHTACALTAKSEAAVQGLNAQEWAQGCEDALQKMGYTGPGLFPLQTPTGQTPTGPTVDCSNPANKFNGACF